MKDRRNGDHAGLFQEADNFVRMMEKGGSRLVHTVSFTNSARFKCLEDLQKDAVDLCLVYCGWEYCNPSHRFGPNQRKYYVLHIVREGRGTLEINQKKYEMGPGDAFFIDPGQEAWYEADKKNPWCYMWMGFIGIRANETIVNAGFTNKNPVRKIYCVQEIKQYIDQMLEAHQLSYADELKRNALLMLCFSTLIDDYHQNFLEGINVNYPYPGSVYVKHAMEYITHHYNERLKINDLADMIGVNRSYLANSFKKNLGCSPQEFLVDLRMKKARFLLKTTDSSIHAVASAVGYTDQLAFSKVFKRHCGMSPRMYKEQKSELVIRSIKSEGIGEI